MLLDIYKAMMQASTPLLEAYLEKRARRGKEDPARAPERRGQPPRARDAGPLVWFHAASVGESLSLLSVIGRLLEDFPQASVMVTTGTVTSAKLMAERLPPRAFHQYIPVDHPSWVARFLDHWRPDFVLWAESEFWPNMLRAIKARGIPAALLNARMSERSFRRWQWAKEPMREMLSVFTLCLAQNEAEAGRLSALGARDARVSANLKYGAAPLPFDAAKLAALKEEAAGRTLLLWASTHPGEEKIALETHKALRRRHGNLATFIVPRHPARGAEVKALAEQAGLPASLRSAGGPPGEIYVADTMGELGLFYRLCKIAVVGGSFTGAGGHNLIEPGQLGCVIFYGPDMHNFLTISDDFQGAGAAVQVKNAAELQGKLDAALSAPGSFAPLARAAQTLTREKSGIVDGLAGLLNPLLAPALEKGTRP